MLTNIITLRENVTKSFGQIVTSINKRVVSFNITQDEKNNNYNKENRGKWSSSWDFQAACLCHAFGMKHFTLLPSFIFMHWGLGLLFLVSYIVDLIIFTLPIFFIQSFLGQFSSSGYISAFRAAPIAKGLGYVILAFNVISAGYGSVNAAVPLVYIFSSINPNLPWTNCNNGWNTVDCKDEPPKFIQDKEYLSYTMRGQTWSSIEYFYKAIALKDSEGWQISWRILACTIIVWMSIGAIIRKGLKSISKLFRYSVFFMCLSLLAIFIRILCLPGTVKTIIKFFFPNHPLNLIEFFMSWVYAAAPSALTFGPGWGTILTISSFNHFNKNIRKLSIVVCCIHMMIVIVTGICVFLVRQYLQDFHNFQLYRYGGVNQLDYIYIAFPYLFGKLELSQLWSIVFFLMIFLSELSSAILQIFSVLTALFDEHQKARERKTKITISLMLALFIASIFFASNRGFIMFSVRYSIEGMVQMLICLLEMTTIIWIFGRIRFQRDVKFMLNWNFKTWQFYLIRFITPLCVLLVLIFYIITACIDVLENKQVMNPASLITIKLIPFFLFIPGYILTKLLSITDDRETNHVIKELCEPKNWHPVDDENFQKYCDRYGEPIYVNIHQQFIPPVNVVSEPINLIGVNGDISQLRKISEAEICIEFDI